MKLRKQDLRDPESEINTLRERVAKAGDYVGIWPNLMLSIKPLV